MHYSKRLIACSKYEDKRKQHDLADSLKMLQKEDPLEKKTLKFLKDIA